MSKQYELMTIAKVDLGESGAKKLLNQVKETIGSFGGEVSESNSWGKRKFAYRLKGDTEGYYDVLKFEMEGESIDKFKSELNLMEGLVRYLVTAIEK